MSKRVALLIGVSEYAGDLEPLPAAVRDIEAMRSVLEAPEIGGFDRVVTLANPDLGTMQREIANLFKECGKDSLLLLYFSGHGVIDEGGRFHFTNRSSCKFSDGTLNPGTVVAAKFVHELMGKCQSQRIVVILDCCHSGAFGDNIGRRLERIDFGRELGGEGRIILTSSSGIGYSFERPGEELAVYTRYLVEGLETGAADLDTDGKISAIELHNYVKGKLGQAMPLMQPEKYTAREGEQIILAKAVIGDPKQAYRKLVKKHCEGGEIRPAERALLDLKAQELGLSAEEAKQIEDEVLQPYREHQQNLEKYEETLRQYRFPIDDRDRRALTALQEVLGLTDDNVKVIKQKIDTDNSSKKVDSRPKLTNFTEKLTPDIFLDMVAIPGGTFWMGAAPGEKGADDNERPQHEVTIDPCFMAKYPITQKQWRVIAAVEKIDCILTPYPSKFQGENLPVERVSWNEAVEFCKRLSHTTGKKYRLPTEAEWEYACRAGRQTPFHFGETISTDLANYNGRSVYGEGQKGQNRAKPTEVGFFQANPFALYDLHGNVWEWCLDHWHEHYDGAPIDGSAWIGSEKDRYRVLRGGSWYSNAESCRSASRHRFPASTRRYHIGFRIVCHR